MATKPDLRREIADERRRLTDAVASLRTELEHTAERGKRIGAAVGAVAGAALTLRAVRRLRRRHR
jgi:hypothetical protein